ncbi:MAG TPA: type II secretion system F family protein [Candidatus Saccharimonadales bacterium]|nr:type II secretion system F family protein [Candidatus Saccharimonadales bacterium]
MPVYSYTARDSNGVKRLGTVDARSEQVAVTLLKNQGLFVVNLDEQKANFFDQLLNFRGVPQGEVVNFTRQFSTMISSGLPISRALEVLGEQASNKNFQKILLDCLRDVEGGAALSAAMSRYPEVFSETYVALVRAGESSGKLDEILKRLAETMEAQRELSSKFKAAMVYPIIVFFAMIGVFVLMMVFVVPKLADMYVSLNVPLPWITKEMINLSKFMTHNVLLLIAMTIGAVLGFRYFMKTQFGFEFLSALTFKLPVFGKINKQRDLIQFTRTLSLLISSAIPIVEALKIVSAVVVNKQFKDSALQAALNVEKGNSLSDFFKHEKNFPPLIAQMASVGEETGQLNVTLDKVAEYYDSEVDHSVKGLSAALEPIILILLGGMVGVLIISIIVPIYKITSAI